MFSLALQASEFGVDEAFETMELYRLYEGWRGRKNYRAFFTEMQTLSGPNAKLPKPEQTPQRD